MITSGEQAIEPPLIGVVGPTAAGKTAVGISLARLMAGEIISADAVAVYRDLNIGAAKPDASERSQAVFHLLDVVAPDDNYTLTDFEQQANSAIYEIRARGRVPILVGGTGLYIRSVTATLTVPNVPPQHALRDALWRESESQGAPFLHLQLANIDPVTASKIHPGDAKRIIRALEVYRVTGQPMSAYHTAEGVQGVPRAHTYLFGLQWERETLYKRIDNRVDSMMASGFLEEVRELYQRGFGPDLKSMQSLGYRHLLRYLDGEVSLEESVAELKRDTRRYAKRQISWFNGDSQVRWIDMRDVPDTDVTAEAVAAVIYEQVNRLIKSPP